MSFLNYLFYLLSFIFTILFLICIVIQQMIIYYGILQKARKFAKNKYHIKSF